MKDQFTNKWITDNAVQIVRRYEDGILTIRGLHYQLVSIGMTNSIQHYKRVVNAMITARRQGLIAYEKFSDNDREMIGETKAKETVLVDEIEHGKEAIESWMKYYFKNRWENQMYYPEVFIEKKALQGVFQPVCDRNRVALGACKGYPSLTFLNDTAKRFIEQSENGKIPIILYFGDYDPSGEDIPRSIQANIIELGCEDIQLERFALMEHQVVEWKLPPAPAKDTDSRTAKWDGLGQVELDSVEPKKLQRLCEEAILKYFDTDLYAELKLTEGEERKVYVSEIKKFVNEIE